MCLFLDLFKKIYRCTLLQEHRFTGAHCYRSTNPLQQHKFTAAHCYWSTNPLLEHKFTDIPYSSTDLQAHTVKGAQIYRCTLLQEHKSLTGAQIYRCSLLQEHKFTGAHCYFFTNPLQEHKFTGAQCVPVNVSIIRFLHQ